MMTKALPTSAARPASHARSGRLGCTSAMPLSRSAGREGAQVWRRRHFSCGVISNRSTLADSSRWKGEDEGGVLYGEARPWRGEDDDLRPADDPKAPEVVEPNALIREALTPKMTPAMKAAVRASKLRRRRRNVDSDDLILLQGFHSLSYTDPRGWYRTLAGKVDFMAKCGFTTIWLPPPSQSAAPDGYLPGRWFDLNSRYGSHTDLAVLLAKLKDTGIVPLADVVVNLRAADQQGPDGAWNCSNVDFPPFHGDDGEEEDRAWGPWALAGTGAVAQGESSATGGGDVCGFELNHGHEVVRRDIKRWLSYLTEAGFSGWRFNYVQGYAPQYVSEYISASSGKASFNVADVWGDAAWEHGVLAYNQDGMRQQLCNWLDQSGGAYTEGNCSVFDFPTKAILETAVRRNEYWRLRDSNGKPPGLLGWWPSRAVTYIDCHNSGAERGQAHWMFPQGKELVGYAYTLTHPGTPAVYCPHVLPENTAGPTASEDADDLQMGIRNLMDIRRRCGIRRSSPVEILVADADCYVARVGEEGVGQVTVKLGPRLDLGGLVPRAHDGWEMSAYGNDWCIWEKTS
mmetsp:Transcript_21286/g.67360  ORF Transcript_21286/g.67360 Transcript_21286/m.67360 type:complete len:572 (-) Transcript_21286:277-1992(-)